MTTTTTEMQQHHQQQQQQRQPQQQQLRINDYWIKMLQKFLCSLFHHHKRRQRWSWRWWWQQCWWQRWWWSWRCWLLRKSERSRELSIGRASIFSGSWLGKKTCGMWYPDVVLDETTWHCCALLCPITCSCGISWYQNNSITQCYIVQKSTRPGKPWWNIRVFGWPAIFWAAWPTVFPLCRIMTLFVKFFRRNREC